MSAQFTAAVPLDLAVPLDDAIPVLPGPPMLPGQLALPLDWRLPGGLPAEPPPAPRHLRLVTDAESEPGLPPPGPWVARLAPAILEVAAGDRPPAQLRRWVTRELHETLSRRHAAAVRHPVGKARSPQCRRVRSVRVFPVSAGVVEASTVVIGAARARAVAIRLEAIRGRWLATAIEIG